MKRTKWLFAALFAACCSASAADLFFVVGQAGISWNGQQAQGAAPAADKSLSWAVGAKFTPSASQVCKGNCPDVGPVDGV